MSVCKVCNRPIIWARTFGGNLIPLDIKPVIGGTYELAAPSVLAPKSARLALRVSESFKGPAYKPHGAECGKRAAAQRDFEKRQLKLL